MIQVVNLSKSYGDQTLFSQISFSMVAGERLGLVGRNGSGKSTLFKIILGQEQGDQGQVVFPRGYRIGHLEQHLNFKEGSVLKEACLGLPEDERDQEYRAEIILGGLGFSEDDMHKSPDRFSGGFQIRINLAKVLLSEPNLLLLDEPTNYLDIVSARWLTRFLRRWKNEIVIISHDRDFMDSVTTHTMLIHRQKVRKIPGNTEKLYAQVLLDEEIYEKTRINEDKKRRDIEQFINRFRAKASKATLVQSKIKALERMGQKEELKDEKNLDFAFEEAPFQGKIILEAREISFAYKSEDQPDTNNLLIDKFSLTVKPGDRIGVIGKNGKGKSTLLRILAGELLPLEGNLSPSANARIGYFGQTNISRLQNSLTVEDEIASSNPKLSKTGVRNVCGAMMFSGDSALKKISVLSGGEKSRVLLGKLIAHPSNLLFLDEPSNHLDMESIEAVTESLSNYQGAVLIVTHSELILRELVSRLVVFQDHGPEIFEGNYDDFLSTIGWIDEIDDRPSKSGKAKSSGTQSENGEPKSISKDNKKIEKEIELTEKIIKTHEKEIEGYNLRLIEALQSGDSNAIAQLGKFIKEAQQMIIKKQEELDRLMKKFVG